MLVNLLFHIDNNNELYRVFLPLDILLCTTVVPSTYILKTDEVRRVITDVGWWRLSRNLYPFPNVRIVPAENLEMHNLPNANVINNEELDLEGQNNEDENWWMNIDLLEDDSLQVEQEQINENENWWMKIYLFEDD